MNAKNISILLSGLICLTSCTTLNGAEQCALIGQVHAGTQIGTNTQIGSIGSHIYSYQTRAYNPICKLPKTIEEENLVNELYPIAKSRQEKQNTELILGTVGTVILAVGVALLLVNSI